MSETLMKSRSKNLNPQEDIRPSDIVLFSEPLRSALNFTIRAGRFSLTEFEEKLGFTAKKQKRLRMFW